MRFSFDFERTVQAAAYLLKKANGRMNYMVLLKLLYFADREYLLAEGKTITGDKAYAMKNGPVLSNIYRLIEGDSKNRLSPDTKAFWERHIKTDHAPKTYCVDLIADPGDGRLCRSVEDQLDSVFKRFGHMTAWQISAYSHRLPEWYTKADMLASASKREPIDWAEILEDDEEKQFLANRNLELKSAMDSLLELDTADI